MPAVRFGEAQRLHALGRMRPELAIYPFRVGGVHIFDLSRLEEPRSVAYFAEPAGVYLMSSPALGKPHFDAMPLTAWAEPNLKRGYQS